MVTTMRIGRTEVTWNPVRGCTKCSPGYANGYAERIAARFPAPGKPFERTATMTPQCPRWTGEIVCRDAALFSPIRWKRPHRILVNWMSDPFYEHVPLDFVSRVFEIMAGGHWSTFQVLTKRSRQCADLRPHLPWSRNVWMGVSVENMDYLGRIDELRSTATEVKFLFNEPFLGPLPMLDRKGITWVIVGGETGPGASATYESVSPDGG